MSEPIAELRRAVLDRPLAARVDRYRSFRCAFRHMYYFELDWARLGPLSAGAPALVADFEGRSTSC